MSKTKFRLKQRAFLAAYSQCCCVRWAAQLASCARSQHYWWLQRDPEYAKAFAEAKEEACDMLEAEAQRRAVDGIDVPLMYGGRVVATEKKYSDTLLMFLIKGARAEYRDNYRPNRTTPHDLERRQAARVRGTERRVRN